MAGQSGQVVKVSGQQGDQALLSVPMVGFPEGFVLRPGDKVLLVADEGGPSVRPLYAAREIDRSPEDTTGQPYAIQDATARTGEGDRIVIFTVENDSLPAQVAAIHRE